MKMKNKEKKLSDDIFQNQQKELQNFNIEQISHDDPDYKLVEEARKNRANGENIFSLDEVLAYVFENENSSVELKEKIIKIKNFKDFLKLNDLKVKDLKLEKRR